MHGLVRGRNLSRITLPGGALICQCAIGRSTALGQKFRPHGSCMLCDGSPAVDREAFPVVSSSKFVRCRHVGGDVPTKTPIGSTSRSILMDRRARARTRRYSCDRSTISPSVPGLASVARRAVRLLSRRMCARYLRSVGLVPWLPGISGMATGDADAPMPFAFPHDWTARQNRYSGSGRVVLAGFGPGPSSHGHGRHHRTGQPHHNFVGLQL